MKIKNFKISDKCEKHEQGYVIVVNWMYGDADGWSTSEIGTFSEEEKDKLFDAIVVCKRMEMAYPNGRGGYDDYNSVDGFYRWFSTDEEESEEKAIDMEYEPYDNCQASFESFEVFYYNENGEKIKCDFEIEGLDNQ